MSRQTSKTSVQDAGRKHAERRERLARLCQDLETLLARRSSRRIDVEPSAPLVLTRLSRSEVSITQYATANGHPLRNPEIIFEVSRDGGVSVAEPFYYRDDCRGVERYTRFRLSRKPAAALAYRPDLHERLCRFTARWFDNLREKGFFEAEETARPGGSTPGRWPEAAESSSLCPDPNAPLG